MRQPIKSAAVSFCRRFFDDLTDIFFRFEPRDHQFMAASQAFKPEVRAGAQNLPLFLSAGMGFFHHQNIAQSDIHITPPLWLPSTALPLVLPYWGRIDSK